MPAAAKKLLGSYEGIDVYERTWKGNSASARTVRHRLGQASKGGPSVVVHRFVEKDGETWDVVTLRQGNNEIVLSSGRAGVKWTEKQVKAWNRGAFLLPAQVALGKLLLATKKVTVKLMGKK